MNEITPPPFPAVSFARGEHEFPLELPPPSEPVLPLSIMQALENGRMRDLLALDERDFRIRPLASRLAQINRYAGALCWPYSVATHSMLVARLVEIAYAERTYAEQLFNGHRPVVQVSPGADDFRVTAYEALMHDVTEGFGINDLIRPVKQLLPEYCELERRIRLQLSKPFGLSTEESAAVKRADERAYQLECKYMKGAWPGVARTTFEPWPVHGLEHQAALFYCRQELNWRESASLFVQAFERLAPQAVKEVCL